MKYAIVLVLSFLSVFKLSGEYQIQTIEANITDVNLFFNEAQVFRKAEVSLKKGTNMIQISAISPYLIKESLSVNTNKLVAINGISIEADKLRNEENRLSDSNSKMGYANENQLQDSLQFYEAHQEILKSQKAFIVKNRLSIQNEAQSLPHTITDFNNSLKAYEKKYVDLESKIIDNNRAIKKINSRLKAVQAENYLINLKNKTDTKNRIPSNLNYQLISLNIESEKDQIIMINVDYLVRNANWEPVYDIKFSTYDKQPIIVYKAKFFQATGENWNDVNLTYSTAKPISNKGIPQFEPTYLDYFKNKDEHILIKPATTRWEKAKGPVNAASSNPEDAMVMSLVDVPAEYQTVKNIQTDLNLTYKLKEKVSLQTHEPAQFQYLKQANFDANYLYRVLPYLNDEVYKIATISNWQQLNLLSGTANIYAEEAFMGTVDLIVNRLNNNIEFAIGVDEAIVVNKIKLSVNSNKKWLDAKRKDELGYQISIQNKRPQTIQVEVIEQIPLSKQSEIEIELLKKDNASYNKSTGKLSWLLEIESNAQQNKTFSYEVVYPKDKRIGYE